MRTGARGPLAVLVVAVSLLVACGDGGPAPQAWASAVCRALTPWRSEIGTLAERTQQQMTMRTTPVQAKENLVRLFGGAEAASETARAGVEKAGVPSVDGGDEVARGFVASLTAMRDAYGRARAAVEALATNPADAFYAQVGAVVSTLNAEYDKSALDTSTLDSVELKRAFDEVPECR
jgi:hypothetical protein